MNSFEVINEIPSAEHYVSARPVDQVIVHSRGGSAFGSLSLAKAIAEDEPQIYIAGIAFGGAALLAATGGEVVMHPSGLLQLRRCWVQVAGGRKQLEKACGLLEKCDRASASFLAEGRCRATAEIIRYMDEERIFRAEEALRAGLVDRIQDLGGVTITRDEISEIREAMEQGEDDVAGVVESSVERLHSVVEALGGLN